jgi:hypothetical protein
MRFICAILGKELWGAARLKWLELRVYLRMLLLILLAGCTSLLPSEHAEVTSPFVDYPDAEARFAQVIPGLTTRSELFALGFDPMGSGNGRMLSFIDLRLMFIQPNVPISYLPDGLIECLEAKERCIGYAFEFEKSDSKRVGNFWADLLNFRKHREYEGWRFRAAFVLVDDIVIHKLSSGEPKLRRTENQKNPLGPLQGAGEFFSDQLK